MATDTFLAMTAAEISGRSTLPERLAWMACHFSPYGTGLSNLPKALPPDSLLILNDRIPIHGHDPEVIGVQLSDAIERLGCTGLLLDFQRPNCAETANLTASLSGVLPCPVAVSAAYGQETSGPVFLPPLPHHVALSEHIAPWQGREIWLELALDTEVITLTEKGSSIAPLPSFHIPENGYTEEILHCHYTVKLQENRAEFTLWRTREDLDELLKEADKLGVTTTVGLFQEFAKRPS